MTTAVTTETEHSDIRAQAVDAARRVAHLSHEARLVKSLAADAIDDAVHASRHAIKTVKRRAQDLADVRHELAHQVRREPLKAIGIAFGAGVFLGAVTGMIYRGARCQPTR